MLDNALHVLYLKQLSIAKEKAIQLYKHYLALTATSTTTGNSNINSGNKNVAVVGGEGNEVEAIAKVIYSNYAMLLSLFD